MITEINKYPLLKVGLLTPADFSSQLIEDFDEDYFDLARKFATIEYWCGNESINIFEVVGTRHPDYKGMTWIELLQKGKRMDLNLTRFQQNSDYYLGLEKKEPAMSYIMIDNKVYVDADGNHRTCIAKFFFYNGGLTHLHGVELRRYHVDEYSLRCYSQISSSLQLRRLNHIAIRPVRRKISREDTAGWMKERYAVSVAAKNLRTEADIELQPDDLGDFIMAIDSNKGLRRYFSNNRYVKFLKD